MSKVICLPGERIRIGGNIEIVIVRTKPDMVEMSIQLPPGVSLCKQSPTASSADRSVESYYSSSDNEQSPYVVECS
ncbi:MAG: hypothetical protein DCC68_15440 [Planctomycetota bacterium]|nr:MAG: hypothetical protein DCC68_15440 [Planctomycetota bacterium]